MPTDQNPVDLGSTGGNVSNAVLWINGPSWLSFPDKWPTHVDIGPSAEPSTEAKEQKEVLAMALSKKDEFTEHMEKYNLKKTLRIFAWLTRFYFNCRSPKTSRVKGQLCTDEIKNQGVWWTKQAQTQATCPENFRADKLQLNLQPDLLTSLQTSKFITSLKVFIARRGRPSVIHTVNRSIFQAAADWMNKVQKDEKFHSYLVQHDITWRFNLSRAPWWGGR